MPAAWTWPDDAPRDGESFLPLLKGEGAGWRPSVLYEYLWEWNYPHTPTTHAVIGDRWKYIRYHGVWDTDELFDLSDRPARDRST